MKRACFRPIAHPFSLALIFTAFILSGCERREEKASLYVSLQNAEGVVPGSPVVWRGVEIGKVESLRVGDPGISVAINLHREYEGQLRADAKAKPVSGIMTRNLSVVTIYGGTDATRDLLPHGATIPEATFLDTYSDHIIYKHKEWFFGGFLLLIIGVIIVRGVVRLFIVGIAALLCVGSLWLVKQQWDNHKQVVLTPEIEARLDELANETIRSPQVVDYWNQIQGDMRTIFDKAHRQGKQASEWSGEQISDLIKAKADEAIEKGEQAAADELNRLKDRFESMLDSLDKPEKTSDVEGSGK